MILQAIADYKGKITREVSGREIQEMMKLVKTCDLNVALAQVYYYGYVMAKTENKKGVTKA